MARYSFSDIALKALHCTVPLRIEPVDDQVAGRSGESLAHVQKVLGITSRHIASPGQTTADLMIRSCRQIMEKAAWHPDTIDVICCVTQTPDYSLPGNSFIIHRECGLPKTCLCLDLSHGCSGFTHGLTVLASLLSATPGKRGILVVGDTLSRAVSKDDPATNLLFGDGIGTVAVESGNGGSTLFCAAGSQGKGLEYLCLPSASTSRFDSTKEEDNRFLHMNGIAIFNFSITAIPVAIQDTLGFAGLSVNEIDYFVFHQANRFIIESIAKKLHLPPERVLTELEEFGNTSGASIPLALCNHFASTKETAVSGRFLFCGFGAGLSWSCMIAEIRKLRILPVEEM